MESRSDIADCALIAAVASGLREWARTTGGRVVIRPLREVIWFYWEGPRLPRPLIRSKYPRTIPWSAAARAVYLADKKRGRLVVEHAHPVALLVDQLLTGPELDAHGVRRVLNTRTAHLTVVTPEENSALTSAGVAAKFPTDDPGTDPWSRYRKAGLDVDGFVPLDEAINAVQG